MRRSPNSNRVQTAQSTPTCTSETPPLGIEPGLLPARVPRQSDHVMVAFSCFTRPSGCTRLAFLRLLRATEPEDSNRVQTAQHADVTSKTPPHGIASRPARDQWMVAQVTADMFGVFANTPRSAVSGVPQVALDWPSEAACVRTEPKIESRTNCATTRRARARRLRACSRPLGHALCPARATTMLADVTADMFRAFAIAFSCSCVRVSDSVQTAHQLSPVTEVALD